MAKTLVAKVATVASVSAAEPSHVFADLPTYVSSAAGELGLLSLRPRENPTVQRRRGTKRGARRDRAIGAGVKGDLLRAIYVRIAMWMVKTGQPSAIVTTSDDDIAAVAPFLIGAAAKYITKVKDADASRRTADIRRTVSQMAFDWKSVIGAGATCRAEETEVDVTFHLEGTDPARRFWFTVETGVDGVRAAVTDPPIHGATLPVALAAVVEETKEYHVPFMQWAEVLRGAAMNGDPVATAAVAFIKATGVLTKGATYVLAAALVSALLFFAIAPSPLQARVIEWITTQLRTYTIRNEMPDYGLPQRLRIEGPPAVQDKDVVIHNIDDYTMVVTIREPERIAREFRRTHQHNGIPAEHIEWAWRIRASHMQGAVWKSTENPQLRVVFDRPRATVEELGFEPVHVVHKVGGPIEIGRPPSLPPLPSQPPRATDFDQRDILVIADPSTYSPSPRRDHGPEP